jgi:hypothetical protein
MKSAINHFFTLLLGSGISAAIIATAILKNPELVEKWIALFWKFVMHLKVAFGFAHKKYVQYDVQGSVNDFIRHHAKEMPGFQVRGVKLEWEDADIKRQAFLDADRVVVRVRRDDPHHENFVKAVYLFVATSLLYRAKRYISPSQGRAIDLFVATEVFREEKPEVIDHFLEEYLHPNMDDSASKTQAYFQQFETMKKAGLFLPVFLQEMDFLGQKVFGNRRSQHIVIEVDSLIDFLESLSVRRVGDEKTGLHFVQQSCRFAVVIVGKPAKLSQSIVPYVSFIRNGLDRSIETVYLLGRAENEQRIGQVCNDLSDLFTTIASKKISKVILYGEEKRKIDGFVAVLRSRTRELVLSSDSPL